MSIEDDIKKLLYQGMLGLKPTELCTYSDNVLRENRFVKSLSDSTTLVDGRIQVRMPWNENGPPQNAAIMTECNLPRNRSREKNARKS